ncbi:phosphotransferase family protein [Algoriphagus confluentis]|uniref:Phosphotransferase family protein n=1 Tax=Algoriphagus confluentis TaxID=1697556 RepID=A0ABQ6PKJ0_9BACT|nr:phosphotransferase family protein [Algoriphagus confluentis]
MDNPRDFSKLKKHLQERLYWKPEEIGITQIAGGFSNLTFQIETPLGKFAMRRPPYGEKISKAHDMARECNILVALEKAGYPKAPKPILLFEDEDIIGAPFFIMEFVDGLVLRNRNPTGMLPSAEEFELLSKNTVDCLLELHLLELKNSGLIHLGKPEGYIQRQVEGWIDRYFRAKTNNLPEMEKVADWMKSNRPEKENVGFIHNDFKYDNVVVNRDRLTEIKAVLDWEMATVGDPLMDLGTSLAYWAQEDDPDILKMFNLTHLPGNMTRAEVIHYYDIKSPLDLSNMLFFYVFGLFKVGVIAQQIYKRHKQGFANDPRFAALIHVVNAAGKKAEQSILTEKI